MTEYLGEKCSLITFKQESPPEGKGTELGVLEKLMLYNVGWKLLIISVFVL